MKTKIVTDGIVLNPARTLARTKKSMAASFLCSVSHIKSFSKKII